MPLGLESGVWLWVAAAGFALGHLLVLAYFVRGNVGRSEPSVNAPPEFSAEAGPGQSSDAEIRGRGDGESRPTRELSHGAVTDGDGPSGGSGELPPIERDRIVQCPHCGVKNAAEFRFCRFCVGELMGGTTLADGSEASRDGQAF
ncbi:zinc ribbon domain-containing protein [Salinarchaeum laminariae]|uniref:zinc ribbon domain-containing protein n=1 Tax=Salinarchaeum laminariae TaxID=869888 RepID=UPI0020BDD71D|nr:zinc ribbon domain-containing protein [Salinarchaeum laminariae]